MIVYGAGQLARQELAARLEAEQVRLRGRLNRRAEAVRDREQPGGASIGEEGSPAEQAARLAVEHAAWEQLAEVEVALRRVAAGQYGRCEACASPLEFQRLFTIPWARYCAQCTELDSAERPLLATLVVNLA